MVFCHGLVMGRQGRLVASPCHQHKKKHRQTLPHALHTLQLTISEGSTLFDAHTPISHRGRYSGDASSGRDILG